MNQTFKSMNPKIIVSAKIVWNYMQLGHTAKPVDLIFVLGSRDDRVALYAAELFGRGISKRVLVSGGSSHKNDLLATKWSLKTEAQHFANILINEGVPANHIILEDEATNTGQNISFSYKLLASMDFQPRSILLLQKP